MANDDSIIKGIPLKASAMEVIDLVSDEDSVDAALDSHGDREPAASKRLETMDSDDDVDDDDWSLYEDVFDVLGSDEVISGGSDPSTRYSCLPLWLPPLTGRKSRYLHVRGSSEIQD
jgi:hypothetical protein